MQDPNVRRSLRGFFLQVVITQSLAFLAVVVITVFAIVYHKKETAFQIASILEGTLKRGDYREGLYTLSSATLGSFSAIGYFDREGRRVFSLPATLNPSFFSNKSFVDEITNATVEVDLFSDETKAHKVGSVVFIYGRAGFLPVILGIWLLVACLTVPGFRRYRKLLDADIEKSLLIGQAEVRDSMARQVRHDIRSPVQAIVSIAQYSKTMQPDEKEVLLAVAERVLAITNDLSGSVQITSERNPAQLEPSLLRPVEIACLAQEIVAEKQIQMRNRSEVRLSFAMPERYIPQFVEVNEAELKRSLSNLLDNAIESLDGAGSVQVALDIESEQCRILVRDSGRGISKEVLGKLGTKGLSIGKAGGSGLGFHYAKSKIEEWKGQITAQSTVGIGTEVTVNLPLALAPVWSATDINLAGASYVLVLDDDVVICETQRNRINGLLPNLIVKTFQIEADLLAWLKSSGAQIEDCRFLVDYDLGRLARKGTAVIESLQVTSLAYLVTNRFGDVPVQTECEKLGIRLVPKPLIQQIAMNAAI